MTTVDPVLAEKFRKLLTGEEKGYAPTAWQELARVAAEHYDEQQKTRGRPVVVPRDLLEGVAQRLYVTADAAHRAHTQGASDA